MDSSSPARNWLRDTFEDPRLLEDAERFVNEERLSYIEIGRRAPESERRWLRKGGGIQIVIPIRIEAAGAGCGPDRLTGQVRPESAGKYNRIGVDRPIGQMDNRYRKYRMRPRTNRRGSCASRRAAIASVGQRVVCAECEQIRLIGGIEELLPLIVVLPVADAV